MNNKNSDYPLDLDQSPLIAKKQGRKEIQLRFEPQAFEEENNPDFKVKTEQVLRYGCRCSLFFQRKFSSPKQYIQCYISISEDANDQLYFYDLVENKVEIIDIFKVADIEEGKNYPIAKQKNVKIPDDKDLWLSFYYEKSKSGIMLLFEKKQQRDMLWAGFQNLVIEYKYKKMNREENSSYDDIMEELSNYEDMQLFTFKETKEIINRLQLKMSQKYLSLIYNQINQEKDKKNQKDKQEFQKIDKRQLEKLIKTLMTHPEIFHIFEQYNGQLVRDLDQYSMNIDQFKHFLKTEQFENWNQKELAAVFSYLSTEQFSDKLSFIGFCRLIFSKKNTLFDPNKCKYPQDMDQPITSYYINTCRNLYSSNLDFSQYFHFPDSSERGNEEWDNCYKHIYFMLKNGVRFFELEIWDGDQGQPCVMYGHTMTQKILLSDLLEKLMENVFLENPYPFFISLETHCSAQQNIQAIKNLKEIIGQHLYLLPKNYYEAQKYPSPNQLKHKVILTGRIASWTQLESDELAIKNNVLDKIEQELQQVQYQDELLAQQKKSNINIIKSQTKQIPKPKLKTFLDNNYNEDGSPSNQNKMYNQNTQGSDESDKESEKNNQIPQPPSQTQNKKDSKFKNNPMCKDLSGYKNTEGLHNIYGLYTHSIKSNSQPSMWEIYQMNIQEMFEYLKNKDGNPQQLLKDTVAHEYPDIVSFSKKFLLKLSPVGKKIDSTNFNPLIGFKAGFQFITNHPHTFDISSLIYQAKFQENNGCGYVLKPPELRDTTNAMQRSQKINVILKVVSGYQLRTIRGESINPYVEILLVSPIDKENQLFSTNSIQENNFNPLWKTSNTWKFSVEQPDISFLVFQAISSNKEQKHLLGWFAMPCNSLRQGYRVIPLKDDHFCTIKNSYLLVHSEVSPRQL